MNHPRHFIRHSLFAAILAISVTAHAQVPQLIHYQSRVAVGGVNFEGSGQFKFALVNTNGSTTYWSNDGTSIAGSQPAAAVTLPVAKGLYSVHLGDTALANMTVIPASVFTNADVRLRVWFNDGTNGSQLLTPDHRIAAVGYAMVAGALQSGADINAGTVTATTFSGSGAGLSGVAGALPWIVVSGTSQQAAANTGYVAANAAEVTVTLPASPAVGDIVRVSGAGTGGWKMTQNAGQTVATGAICAPGASWTARDANRDWQCVASSADGTKLVAGVNGGQLYVSTNSGLTWVPRENNRAWRGVASSADGAKLVAVVNNDQIYTSTDSGDTWTARATARAWSAVASSSDGTKLAACVAGGRIFTSIDSGISWTQRFNLDAQWLSIASDANGSTLIAVSASSGVPLAQSSDSGVSWVIPSLNGTTNFRSVASSADGSIKVAAGDKMYVYKSVWSERVLGVEYWSSVACSADGTKLFAINGTGTVYASSDGGTTWGVRGKINGTAPKISISADGTKLVATTQFGQLFTSSDSTSVGADGFLRGEQSSSIELQYVGNGRFLPINSVGDISSH